MATQIKVPKLGVSMAEGELLEWMTEDGAEVAQGDLIYLLGTDKTEVEIEAPVAGVIRQIGEPGTVYDVGDVVAEIS